MNIADFEHEMHNQNSVPLGRYLREYPMFLNYAKAAMENIDFSLIDFDVRVTDPFFIVRIHGGNISVEKVEPKFSKENDYKLISHKYYLKRYTPDELRYHSEYLDSREPNIPLKFNPGVTRKAINEAKQKVKSFKNAKKD